MRALLEQSLHTALIVAVCSAAGCAGTELLNWRWHNVPRASDDNPVVRILCIWEPAEGTGLDGLPTRGFAGQMFFFTAGSPIPVRVDGDVRVYLFDNYGTPDEQSKPIHQFDFIDDAWTIHLHKGTLGPSYHVFVPYVRKHPYQVSCGLRVRLKPPSGPALFSDMVHVTLPGPEPPAESQPNGAAPRSVPPDVRRENTSGVAKTPQGASLTRQTIPLTTLNRAHRQTTQRARTNGPEIRNAEAVRRQMTEGHGDDRTQGQAGQDATGQGGKMRPASLAARPSLQPGSSSAGHPLSRPPDHRAPDRNRHPLRFKLQPAQFAPQQTDTARNGTAEHPLTERKTPNRVDISWQPTLRRHPLADEPEQTKNESHRHPLADD